MCNYKPDRGGRPESGGRGIFVGPGRNCGQTKPGPGVNRITVIPSAAMPPAKMEPHSTAEAELSTDRSSTLGGGVSCHLWHLILVVGTPYCFEKKVFLKPAPGHNDLFDRLRAQACVGDCLFLRGVDIQVSVVVFDLHWLSWKRTKYCSRAMRHLEFDLSLNSESVTKVLLSCFVHLRSVLRDPDWGLSVAFPSIPDGPHSPRL